MTLSRDQFGLCAVSLNPGSSESPGYCLEVDLVHSVTRQDGTGG